MSKATNILLVLNGHKYVSYFFEPIAQYARSQGLKVGLAMPLSGLHNEKNWPLDNEVTRFKTVTSIKHIFGFFSEIFQAPFVASNTHILHAVTTHMIFLLLIRLSIRREHFSGMFVMHFIGLGRALGGKGFFSFIIRILFKLIWALRRRKGLTYSCIYLNEDDYQMLTSVFGTKHVTYFKVPGAGIRKDRFQFHKKSVAQPIRLLFLGRLIKEKGIERFIRLIEDIDRRTDISVIGDVVGGFENSAYGAKIKRSVSTSKLRGIINFVGEVSEPNAYFQKAHFFIFPSYYGEGVPTVLLESQYCGTPCLASNIAGCREAVLDGVKGRLVPSAGAEDWFFEFMKIFEEMDYQEMCSRAHNLVREQFDAELLAAKTIDWLILEHDKDKAKVSYAVSN
jgi:glycosyltransferase involved in cell wall biosynthesis